MTAFDVDGLVAGYERPFKVLDGISLSLEAGQVMGVVGRNGVGKTTLVRVLCGLRRQWSGNMTLEGVDISHRSPRARILAGLATVPEARRIFGTLTVRDNLEIAAAGCAERQWRERLPELLNLFPQVAARLDARAGTLSGGEQQMLAIARGLITRPKVLIMDEPSLGLAPGIVRRVEEVIRRVAEGGVGVLLLEQNHQMTMRVAETVLLMDGLGGTRELTQEEVEDVRMVGRAILGGDVRPLPPGSESGTSTQRPKG